jgi:nitrate/TMAO reductase-like tetraheme cytochrome c subunit
MTKRLLVLIVLLYFGLPYFGLPYFGLPYFGLPYFGLPSLPGLRPPSHAQNLGPDYRNNNCVTCHATLSEPLHISSRFYEWQDSRHQARNVGCEQCHGGNPAVAEAKQAHAGVFGVDDPRSRMHYRNQPETCGSCHRAVVRAFVQSAHYQKLKGVGLGASCNTCHAHMATQVLYSAKETAEMCARCHEAINYLAPRPDIPLRANDTMQAFQRANSMLNWAMLLLADAQRRGMDLRTEQAELLVAKKALADAQISWHEFKLEDVRKQADAAFFKGMKVRDELRRKLGIA